MRRTSVLALGAIVALAGCDSIFGPSSSGPVITAISPATLTMGGSATITGRGFAASAGQNAVTIGGVSAQVLEASATQLVIEVPGAGSFPCGPTMDQDVVVTVDGEQATTAHPLATATVVTLGVGQSVALHGNDTACNELAAGGTYLMSVFNVANTPGGLTAFKVRGTVPGMAADVTALVQRQRYQLDPPPPTPPAEPMAAGHLRMLEANRRVSRQLGVPRPVRDPRAPGQMAMTMPTIVGTTRTFRIPDIDASNLCSSYHSVTARAVFVGPTAVIWEDEEAALAGTMDARWQQIGQEYETVMQPIIEEFFGDPLAYDDFIGQHGYVSMLFSEQINDFDLQLNGFVYSGDFYRRADQCASSDEAAVFYGRVPTVAGEGFEGNTAPVWAWEMRATIIHEVKHLVSFAHRIRYAAETQTAPNFEAVWLEEATARLAEEFYARALSGYGQGGNVTYEQSIWCERRLGPNWPDCDPIPAIMVKHFNALYTYYGAIENRSPLGPTVSGDGTFYGSGWLLVRWAMDHSGMSEAAFSRALVDEFSSVGVANLSARAGRPFRDMLADFTLAIAVDNHPSGVTTTPELSFPSWNTRDVLGGFHTDISADFYPSLWPLQTRAVSFGNFDVDVGGIRGGTASIFQLTGSGGDRQLIELLSPAGTAAPAALGLAIVRVQ